LPTLGRPTIEMKPDLKFLLSVMGSRIPEISALRNKKAGSFRNLLLPSERSKSRAIKGFPTRQLFFVTRQ